MILTIFILVAFLAGVIKGLSLLYNSIASGEKSPVKESFNASAEQVSKDAGMLKLLSYILAGGYLIYCFMSTISLIWTILLGGVFCYAGYYVITKLWVAKLVK